MSVFKNQHQPPHDRGVVAVIRRQAKFLVIRRSRFVRAPHAFCFPGGGVERGETDLEALSRELQEELEVVAEIGGRLWQNQTASGIRLSWYAATLRADVVPQPNPAEVESIHWLTAGELGQLEGLLATNLDFLSAIHRGDIHLD